MLESMQGYRTWLGIVITTLGSIGLYEKLGLTSDEVSKIMDATFQLFGLLLTSYGNYQAHKKINELQ